MLEHQTERAGRRVLSRKMMMVEVRAGRIVATANIYERDCRIVYLPVVCRAPLDVRSRLGDENCHCKEVIFMRAARVRYDPFNHGAKLTEHRPHAISSVNSPRAGNNR